MPHVTIAHTTNNRQCRRSVGPMGVVLNAGFSGRPLRQTVTVIVD